MNSNFGFHFSSKGEATFNLGTYSVTIQDFDALSAEEVARYLEILTNFFTGSKDKYTSLLLELEPE